MLSTICVQLSSLSSSSSPLVLHSIIALFICVAKEKIDMKMQCMISLTKNFKKLLVYVDEVTILLVVCRFQLLVV